MDDTKDDVLDELKKSGDKKVPGELTKDSGIASGPNLLAGTTTAADVMKKYVNQEGTGNILDKFAEITQNYAGEFSW